MPLPVVPTDSADERQHRTIIATVLNELAKQSPQHADWTAVISGAGTAGTYEIDTQFCRSTRIGRRVWLDIRITLAAVITGGGVGTLQITGFPFSKAANTFPVGTMNPDGIDWTAGAVLALCFNAVSASSTLFLRQSFDNAGSTALPISGLAATDVISGSICYETDDP